MSKFKEDDGVIFASIRDGMSSWLKGRIGVVQEVIEEPNSLTYHILDARGALLVGFEDELEAYP